MQDTSFPKTGLVRKPVILKFLSIGNTKFYDLIKQGKLPAPIKIDNASRWQAEWIWEFAGYNDAEQT